MTTPHPGDHDGAAPSAAEGEAGGSASKRSRARWIVPTAIVAVAVIAGGVTFALTRPAESPIATPTSSPTVSPVSATPTAVTPSATATSEPSPESSSPAAVAYPATCDELFTDGTWPDTENIALNVPGTAASPIINDDAAESFRTALPGFDCRWGEPTEGGMFNSVKQVTSTEQSEAIALLAAAGYECGDGQGGVLCSHDLMPASDDNPDGWWVNEESLFRDGQWIATWASGTAGSISNNTSRLYTSFWPEG